MLKQIQLIDQNRIQILKESLTKWVVFETSLTANRNYDVNGLAAALESVSSSEDQLNFVSALLEQHPAPTILSPRVNDKLFVLSPSQQ